MWKGSKYNNAGRANYSLFVCCLITFLGLQLAYSSISDAKENLLKNPGFEATKKPAKRVQKDDEYTTATQELVTNFLYAAFPDGKEYVLNGWSKYWKPGLASGKSHSGKRSLAVTNNPETTSPYNNFDGILQDFRPPLSIGNYTMSCWLRSKSGKLKIRMGMSDGNFGIPGSFKDITIDKKWKKYEYTDNTAVGRVFIRLDGQAGTFYIDDCIIVKDLSAPKTVVKTKPEKIKAAEPETVPAEAKPETALPEGKPVSLPSDVNTQDALFAAVKDGDIETVKVLLAKGADLTETREIMYGKRTPLSLAMRKNKPEIAKLLLEAGSPFDDKIFESAVNARKPELVAVFIERGADPNARDEYGSPMLKYAKDVETVKVLLDNGADIEAATLREETPLILASGFGGQPAVAEFLIEKGADVSAKDQRGITALMKASDMGKSQVVKALLDNGADVNALDDNGESALLYALSTGHKESPKTIKLLLDAGADINIKNKQGKTPVEIVNGSSKYKKSAPLIEEASQKKAME